MSEYSDTLMCHIYSVCTCTALTVSTDPRGYRFVFFGAEFLRLIATFN